MRTLYGDNTEKLIKFPTKNIIDKNKELTEKTKMILKYLRTILPDFNYVRIYVPGEIHIWIKSSDNEDLKIDEKAIKEFWKEEGVATVEDITPSNREEKIRYFESQKNKTQCYPKYLRLVETSSGIKRPITVKMTYEELQKLIKGFKATNLKSSAFCETIDDELVELSTVTYESYQKVKDIRTLQLSMTAKDKIYKGIIVKGIWAKIKQKEEQKRIKEEETWKQIQEIQKHRKHAESFIKANNKRDMYYMINTETGEIRKEFNGERLLYILTYWIPVKEQNN